MLIFFQFPEKAVFCKFIFINLALFHNKIKALLCNGSLNLDAFELWCWRRLLRVHWTARRSNQSILKEISPEYSLEGWMLKLELHLWAPNGKNWLIGKDPDAGKDWRQGERKTVEDEMVVWHHWLDGHEFEQALGVGDGQGSLECYSPWDRQELDMTEQLNWYWYLNLEEKVNMESVGYYANVYLTKGNLFISALSS